MTNALTKDTRISYSVGSPGVAASAGSPAFIFPAFPGEFEKP